MKKQDNTDEPEDIDMPEEVLSEGGNIQKLEEEVLMFKNMYLRALADYKNLEHRVNNQRVQMKDSVTKNILMELLPVVDNMHQAEIFTKDPGLQMVSKSFHDALKSIGVRELELLGLEYDPYTAEVVEVIPGKEDNIVVEVVQTGYAINDEVIRPGKVKVSKINN